MRDFTRIPIRVDRLVLIEKSALATVLFCFGTTLFFFVSLHPWFFWNIEPILSIFAFMCVTSSLLVTLSRPGEHDLNKRFWLPVLPFTLLQLLAFVNSEANVMRLLVVLCNIGSASIVFMHRREMLRKAMVVTSKVLAVIVIVSLLGFALYLMGRLSSSTSITYGDNVYSFHNFRFFLISETDTWSSMLRFQSVFLEPSHLAVAAAFLLMVQVGEWTRWFNIVLIVAIVLSFSLEGYVLLFCLFFFSRWVLRKHFVRNLLLLLGFFGTVGVASFFYNNGDNMVNILIMQRLEVDDGEMAGNNRTTDSFDAEYESFLNSSDVLTGRQMYARFGNSGYKVFIYTNGFVGLALLLVFYVVMLYNPDNKRAALTASAIAFIHFVIRAHMLMSSCYIPIYYMAQCFAVPNKAKTDEATADDQLLANEAE